MNHGRGERSRCCQDRLQAVVPVELAVFVACLGDAVGVDQHHFARLENNGGVKEAGFTERTYQRSGLPEGDRGLGSTKQEGQGVAATADGDRPAGGLLVEADDVQRAEAFRVVAKEHLVEGGESGRRFGVQDRSRPDGVAGQGGDDRCFDLCVPRTSSTGCELDFDDCCRARRAPRRVRKLGPAGHAS